MLEMQRSTIWGPFISMVMVLSAVMRKLKNATSRQHHLAILLHRLLVNTYLYCVKMNAFM